MCVCVCVCVCVSVCVSVCVCVCVSALCVFVCVSLSVCLFSVCLSVCLFSVCLSVHLCVSVCVSVLHTHCPCTDMSSQEVEGFAQEVQREDATSESLQAAVPPEQPQMSSTSRKVTWKSSPSYWGTHCYSMGVSKVLLYSVCGGGGGGGSVTPGLLVCTIVK